jgi:hypothetical protein
MSKSSLPEYNCWRRMIDRCTKVTDPGYKYYGGRGIGFAPQWVTFERFLQDVGFRPSSRHSLDRYPNNDGNYEPSNVRWATRKQQQANTRKTRYVIFNGKRTPFCTAYQALGMKKETALARIRLGWTPQQVIDRPFKPKKSIPAAVRRKIMTAKGSQDVIAAQFGISQSAVSSIRRGQWA